MRRICPPCRTTHVRLGWDQECSRLEISEYDEQGRWSSREIPLVVYRRLLSFLLRTVRLHYGRRVRGLTLRELDLSLELSPASTQGCDAPECCARKE